MAKKTGTKSKKRAAKKKASKASPKKTRTSKKKTSKSAAKKAGDKRIPTTKGTRGATKRAPTRRRPMTVQLSRAEQALMERMASLDAHDPRYLVLEAALAFKASWVILGEQLTDVFQSRAFKGWGYSTFARYCTDEVQVTSSTARKLVKSFEWLGEEAPDLIPRIENGRVYPERSVPDVNAVKVLADAKKEWQSDRVAEDAYLALKQAALTGDSTATQLRAQLKAAIPEELQKPKDPVKSLRQALTYSVKTIDALREWDGNDDILLRAEELRDAIAHHMPRPAVEAEAA